MSSLNLIYHLLQNAENGQQKLSIDILREFVKNCDYDEEENLDSEESEIEDQFENYENGDTTMSGDDNSSIQEDGESDEDEGSLSLNELEFLLAVVKAGKREIYPFTKAQFLEILETMN
jgi:hypothetical protein